MLMCGLRSGRRCAESTKREIFLAIEHVEARRFKKEKQEMSLFERCVTEGNEWADELAKDGATFRWRRDSSEKDQHSSAEREEVYAALQKAASFHCLEEWHDCEKLQPKPKEKLIFANKGGLRNIERIGVRQQENTVA